MNNACNDGTNCGTMIGELLKSQAWAVVNEEINRQINVSVNRLQTVDPTDIVSITKHQTIIKNLKQLQQFVIDKSNKQED